MGSKDGRQWLDGCFHGRAGHGKNTHIGECEKQSSSRMTEVLWAWPMFPWQVKRHATFHLHVGLVKCVLQP